MKTHQPLSQISSLNPQNATTGQGINIVHVWLMVFIFVGSLVSSLPAEAQSVVPAGYIATPGDGVNQGGSYNYHDNTGSQLTDGIYGANDWSANLGNGNAHEWVGWQAADPAFAFQFAAPVTVNQVGIDFNRNQSASILLPATVTIGGTEFTVDPNAIPNDTRGTLYFNGNWTGDALTVDLAALANVSDCQPGNWMLVDEITFSAAAVPEPSGCLLLAGGFGLLSLCLRRCKIVRQF
jgi:hypothetical protein